MSIGKQEISMSAVTDYLTIEVTIKDFKVFSLKMKTAMLLLKLVSLVSPVALEIELKRKK